MRRIFLYFAVAVVLSLHSLAVLWALALDAAAAPFGAMLPPTELGDGVRTVVLMHHKRLPELAGRGRPAAAARASSASARPLIVHVAQSLRPSEAAAANATGGLEILRHSWHQRSRCGTRPQFYRLSRTRSTARTLSTRANSARRRTRSATWSAASTRPLVVLQVQVQVVVVVYRLPMRL